MCFTIYISTLQNPALLHTEQLKDGLSSNFTAPGRPLGSGQPGRHRQRRRDDRCSPCTEANRDGTRGEREPKGKENERAHPPVHTKAGETKRGGQAKGRGWRRGPEAAGEGCSQRHRALLRRAARAGAASANQHPHTSPLDKYLSCQALYHFGFHQINLDSCNKKRPDALPAARAALTVLLPPHGPRARSVKDRISSHQSGPDFSHAM